MAPDDVLRDIEAIAVEVDAIEDAATLFARRQRLLIELDTAGVLSGGDDVRPHLEALGLPNLVAYHDAARALRAYLASPIRARYLADAAPAALLESRISLDWFRRPGDDRGRPLSRHEFLAGAERAIANSSGADGWMIAKFAGATHVLHHRREVGPIQRLYRAGDEAAPVALTVAIEPFVGHIAARDHAIADRIVYGAYLGAVRVSEATIPADQHAAFLDALDDRAIAVGGTASGATWGFQPDEYVLWRGETPTYGARADLRDALGIIAAVGGVQVRRTGGRVEMLVNAGIGDTWHVAFAKDLATWRGLIFVDESAT